MKDEISIQKIVDAFQRFDGHRLGINYFEPTYLIQQRVAATAEIHRLGLEIEFDGLLFHLHAEWEEWGFTRWYALYLYWIIDILNQIPL